MEFNSFAKRFDDLIFNGQLDFGIIVVIQQNPLIKIEYDTVRDHIIKKKGQNTSTWARNEWEVYELLRTHIWKKLCVTEAESGAGEGKRPISGVV